MKKTIFKDIYPVITFELSKSNINITSIDDFFDYLKIKVKMDIEATYIAIFDHYSHTSKIEGKFMEGLIDAKNFIFCFGTAIPSTKAIALRPKSIGICEFKDKFVIEYIEPPREAAAIKIKNWLEELTINFQQPLIKEITENRISLN
jgi:hypothetical protein